MVFDIKKYLRRSNKDYHLCELQIEVLEKTKTIAELQSKLTDMLLRNPHTVNVIPSLRDTVNTINDSQIRKTNNYGYGQDVLNIAWSTIDSVKSLVDQLSTDEGTKPRGEGDQDRVERIYRSLSEKVIRQHSQDQYESEARTRSKSQQIPAQATPTTSSRSHGNDFNNLARGETRDLRALSNLDI